MSFILAIDLGTTNLKGALFNEEGRLLKVSTRPQKFLESEKEAREHDPVRLWENFVDLVRELSRGKEKEISLLGLTAYQFGFLPLDEKGNPLMGIMTLLDTRSRQSMKELNWDWEEVYRRTGCPPVFLYHPARIMWLKRNKPDIFRKTRYILGSKDYIIFKLFGTPLTEPSLSSATQLLNIQRLEWDEWILENLSWEKEKLPPIVKGEEILGELPSRAKEILGLKGKVYFLPGVYDAGGIALGIGGVGEGKGAGNIGTSAMLRASSPTPTIDEKKMRFQTYYLMRRIWLVGGAINNAGATLNWVADNLKGRDSLDSLLKKAEEVPPGAEGIFFLPYLTGERDPRIGNRAPGILWGIRNFHTLAHITRACLEGIGYSLKLLLTALEDKGVKVEEIRIGGGGTKSSLWMRIIASILDKPLKISREQEVALRRTFLPGITALGRFSSWEEATTRLIPELQPVLPESSWKDIYRERYEKFSLLLNNLRPLWEEGIL